MFKTEEVLSGCALHMLIRVDYKCQTAQTTIVDNIHILTFHFLIQTFFYAMNCDCLVGWELRCTYCVLCAREASGQSTTVRQVCRPVGSSKENSSESQVFRGVFIKYVWTRLVASRQVGSCKEKQPRFPNLFPQCCWSLSPHTNTSTACPPKNTNFDSEISSEEERNQSNFQSLRSDGSWGGHVDMWRV